MVHHHGIRAADTFFVNITLLSFLSCLFFSLSTPKIEESVLLSLFLALTGTAHNVPRDTLASSSQLPPETANAPVQHPLSSKTEILMKILGTLVEMKSEIASKQDHMLKVMADGQTRKRTRDEQDQGQQDSPDSRRQRVD
ncbi:Uncharacterized protein Rs2_02221 [Raphanus sativus]|nr:Uncharacterized protein Rs2_02221 [Raphanus sativus]